MDEEKRILKLAMLFTDAELILQECRDLKSYLSLELQAVRDDRRAQHREFQELVAELRDTLIKNEPPCSKLQGIITD